MTPTQELIEQLREDAYGRVLYLAAAVCLAEQEAEINRLLYITRPMEETIERQKAEIERLRKAQQRLSEFIEAFDNPNLNSYLYSWACDREIVIPVGAHIEVRWHRRPDTCRLFVDLGDADAISYYELHKVPMVPTALGATP